MGVKLVNVLWILWGFYEMGISEKGRREGNPAAGEFFQWKNRFFPLSGFAVFVVLTFSSLMEEGKYGKEGLKKKTKENPKPRFQRITAVYDPNWNIRELSVALLSFFLFST